MAKTIRGTITDQQTNNPLVNYTVKIFEKSDANILKGETVTDSNGNYSFDITVDERTELIIEIYNSNSMLVNTSEQFTVSSQDTIKDYLVVESIGIPCKVSGKIVNSDGSIPSGNYTVKVFRKTFLNEEELGSTEIKSSGKGIFEVAYTKEKYSINIISKLYDSNDQLINETDLVIDSDNEIIINFLLDGDKYFGPSKISQYTKLEDLFKDKSGNKIDLSIIKDDDVKVLAEQEKLNEKTIKHYIRACHLVDEFTIDSNKNTEENIKKIVFALLQNGKNINFANLLLINSTILEKSLKEANDNNIIDFKGSDGKKIEDFNNTIKNFKSIIIDNLSHLNNRASDDEFVLFDIVENLSSSKRISFIESYIQNEDSDEDFWNNLSKITDSEKASLKYNIDLALFSQYNQKVYSELKNTSSSSLKELSQQDIDWLSITNQITNIDSFPPHITGGSLNKKRVNFAKYLSDKISKIYLSGVLKVKVQNNAFGPHVKNFINNNPNFDFFTDRISNDTASNEEIKDTKAIQRIASLLPDNDKIQSLQFLWNNNIKSAHDIIKTGKKNFSLLAKQNGIEIDENNIEEIYTKAQKRHNKALVTMTKYSTKLNTVSSDVFVNPNDQDANLESLFEAFDYCEGEHCSSTLGPAAYLADNLMFLKKITIEGSASTFYDKLIERRPDIAKIDLNCSNSKTLIPYIDVVNEVLEQAVIQTSGTTLSKGLQTKWTTTDVNANPEHNFQEAYNLLKKAKNPLKLPFNFWYEEAKVYLDHLGVNLYDLIEKFPYQEDKNKKKIDYATDYLNLTVSEENGDGIGEKDIITSTNFSYTQLFNQNKLIKNGNILVTELIRQAGLKYDELLKMLQTSYIGNKEINYIEDCSLHDAVLKNFSRTGSYCDLDKLLRFKRLQNKLEWTATELDRVISYISSITSNKDYAIDVFDDAFIINLATIKKIKDETNASPEEMLSWWNDLINTTSNGESEASLYKTEFINNSVVGENISLADGTDPDTLVNNLSLTDNKSELRIFSEAEATKKPKIKDFVPDIIANLNISANDINEVLNKEEAFKGVANKNEIELNLGNLSKIYKRANFSKKINISIKDYYTVNQMIAIPADEIDTPIHTIKFIDFYKSLIRSGFSINDLQFILQHQVAGTTDLIVDSEKKDLFINELINKITEYYNNTNDKYLSIHTPQDYDELDNKVIVKLDDVLSTIIAFNLKNQIIKEDWQLNENNKKIIIDYCNGTDNDLVKVTSAINESKQVFKNPTEAIAYLSNVDNTNLSKTKYTLMSATSLLVENEIIQEISSHFNIDTEISRDLIYKYIYIDNKPGIDIFNHAKIESLKIQPDVNITDYNNLYERIHKTVIFIKKFVLTKDMLKGIHQGVSNHQWLDIFNLPYTSVINVDIQRYNKWFKLFSVIEYNYTLFDDKTSIFKYFNDLEIDNGDLSQASLKSLCKITNWDIEHTQFLLTQFEKTDLGVGYHYDYTDIIWLQKLNEASKILKQTGVKPQNIINWIRSKQMDTFFASQIRLDVKSKYTLEEWEAIAPDLMNDLREKRRDALSNYLILKGVDNQVFKDANDLYAYFLFDTEMSSCNKISRIVLAHSVLQLFMLRISLNLESNQGTIITMPKHFSEEWKWRKKYRVWEANRKVFLYPENWIEPQLRDDKSELFTELENSLKQVDITDETVEGAYTDYLEKLGDISKLEIAQHYLDIENNKLYVFAHTYEQPHLYYFRTRDSFGEWSAWERVNIEIEGKNMVPIVFRNKLYVFWLQTLNQSEGVSDSDLEIDMTSDKYKPKTPNPKNEYKVAWSEYRNGKWTAKRLFNKSIEKSANISAENDLTLHAHINQQNPTDVFIYLLPNSLDNSSYFVNSFNKPMILEDLTNLKNEIESITISAKTTNNQQTSVKEIPIDCDPDHENWPDCIDDYFVEPPYSETESTEFEVSSFRLKAILRKLKKYQLALNVIKPALPRDIDYIFLSAGTSNIKLKRVLNKLLLSIDKAYFYVNETDFPIEIQIDIITTYVFRFRPNAEIFGAESTREYLIDNIENGIKEFNKVLIDKTDHLALIYKGNPVVYADDDSDKSLVTWEDNKESVILLNPDTSETLASRRLTLPHQFQFYKSQTGLFLEDDEKVFFIEPDITSLQTDNVDFNESERSQVGHKHVNALLPIIKKSLPVVESNINYQLPAKVVYKNIADNTYYALNNENASSQGVKTKQIVNPYIARYKFYSFYHPYTDLFINQIGKYGVEGLLAPKNIDASDLIHQEINTDYFQSIYNPTNVVKKPYPIDNIDFAYKGAYSVYNWELFFHAPLMIAEKLSKNRKFEEAQKWFHYIFDPTESEGNAPHRYWRIKPFADYNDQLTIMDLMNDINAYDEEAEIQLEKWQQNPFKPHLIARLRIVAYMKNVLMKYLDNLIAWGDSLFKMDSIEYINEAVQIYILAANILGRQPVKIKRGTLGDGMSFEEMDDLGPFGNLMIDLEDLIYSEEQLIGDNNRLLSKAANKINKTISYKSISANDIGSLTTVLYFGIPENSKMLAYWNTVADRLFKIRHCMNIEGIERQLALFEPVIDPALLVNAAANGLSIGDALMDLQADIPHYRFRYIIQKALEYTGDIKALGQALLAALEKRDAEELALLRAGQEENLLKATTYIKEQSILEAQENIKALEITKSNIAQRRDFYKNRKPRILQEKLHLEHLNKSHQFQQISQGIEALATYLSIIPQFNFGVEGACSSPVVESDFGGQQLSSFARGAGIITSMIASSYQHQATVASIKGGYDRRQEEWDFQRDSAKNEIKQIEKQIISSQIRLAIAQRDLNNHQLQIENSLEAKDFMESKYTKKELYDWMINEISNLHFNAYQTAYDLAKKAEKTWRFELGKEISNFINADNWNSLKQGLLAGDKLQHQLRQLEMEYIDQNERENELTKQISLAMLNPHALIELQATGICTFEIPEVLYDIDFPGHYFRRIKSVSLTIPSVTGPYTGVNCRLTLLDNRYRKSTDIGTSYAQTGSDDRFVEDQISRTIATSSGRNDAGMFEVNFNDERYLPFEGKGAIGKWQIELPNEFRQFDYETINDVILSINYTAREGNIKTQVVNELTTMINTLAENTMLSRIISLKSEFSDNLHELLTNDTKSTVLRVSKKQIPYLFKEKTVTINAINAVVTTADETAITGKEITINGSTMPFVLKNAGTHAYYQATINVADFVLTEDEQDISIAYTDLGDLTSNNCDDFFLILEYTIS